MFNKYNIDWLRNELESENKVKFIFFWGNKNISNTEVGNFVFSQWYEITFVIDGIKYYSSEQWMMAEKARLFNDSDILNKILASKKPGEAKSLGREVKGFDENIWNEKRFEIVVKGNINKFGQNKKLKEYLIKTNNRVLVEASPVDIIWGIGLDKKSSNIYNIDCWRGLNLLGFALMETRDYLNSNI